MRLGPRPWGCGATAVLWVVACSVGGAAGIWLGAVGPGGGLVSVLCFAAAQWLVLRLTKGAFVWWVPATVLGGFTALTVSVAMAFLFSSVPLPTVLEAGQAFAVLALGSVAGAVIGLAQAATFGGRGEGARGWVLARALGGGGWMAVVAAVALVGPATWLLSDRPLDMGLGAAAYGVLTIPALLRVVPSVR